MQLPSTASRAGTVRLAAVILATATTANAATSDEPAVARECDVFVLLALAVMLAALHHRSARFVRDAALTAIRASAGVLIFALSLGRIALITTVALVIAATFTPLAAVELLSRAVAIAAHIVTVISRGLHDICAARLPEPEPQRRDRLDGVRRNLRRRVHNMRLARQKRERWAPTLEPDGLSHDDCSGDQWALAGARTRTRPQRQRYSRRRKVRALVDSGCTCHMFSLIDRVTSWITKTSTTVRGVASSVPAVGIGVVSGLAGLVVPSMKREMLLSVARLCDSVPGGQVLFTRTNVYFGSFDRRDVHATGKRDGHLYYVDPDALTTKSRVPTPPPAECYNLTADALPTNRARTAHWRLGHIAYSRLKEIRDKDLLTGVDFTDDEWHEAQQNICHGCAAGACAKKPTTTGTRGSTSPLGPAQHVHMDLIDLAKLPGRNGEKYCLVVVCAFTRKVWAYPMKAKNEAFDHFQAWRASVQTHLKAHTAPNMHITTSVRVDGEGDFNSTSFNEYCAHSGITIQRSVPGETHAALAEAAIKQLKRMSRCMLLEAPHLNRAFWPDALLAAAYTYNRLPRAALSDRTPQSLWGTGDTDVGHLRVFGSPCAVHLPRKKRGTGASMARTCELGIIIGYDPQFAGCYKIWIPAKHGIMRTTKTKGNVKSIINRLSVYADENRVVAPIDMLPQATDATIPDGHWFSGPPPKHRKTAKPRAADSPPSPAKSRDTDERMHDPLIGRRIRKKFATDAGDRWFVGTITGRSVDLKTKKDIWQVSYPDDGDVEDLFHEELAPLLLHEPPDLRDSTAKHECNSAHAHDEHWCMSAVEEMEHVAHVDPTDLGATVPRSLAGSMHACFTMGASWRNWATGASCYHTGVRAETVKAPVYADSIKIPKSVRAAYSSKQANDWRNAVRSENESIDENDVFLPVRLADVPFGTRILRAKYVLRVKCDAQGLISRFKARMVVLGHLAVQSIHYFDTYSPAARAASVKLVLALAAIMNLDLRQYDCHTAFLGAPLDEEIYMYLPEGYEPTKEATYAAPSDWQEPARPKRPAEASHGRQSRKNARSQHRRTPRVVRLKRSLYGLPQSPRCFWKKIDAHLKRLGFTRSVIDPCIMYRIGIHPETKKHEFSVLALVVDDIVLATNLPRGIFLREMEQEFKMKDIGDLEYCLGLKVTRNREKHELELSQEGYIQRVLRTFAMESEHVAPTHTPCATGPPLGRADAVKYADGEEHPWPFRSLLGSIMYACVTRVDIQYAVSIVAKFCTTPGIKAWTALRRILRYLRTTSKRTVKLGGVNPILYVFADADWCGDPDELRSTSGVLVYLGRGPLVYYARLQKATALSTTESEFMASGDAVFGPPHDARVHANELRAKQDSYANALATTQGICNVLGLRTILQELGFPQPPTYIFTDSAGNRASIANPVTTKLRHVGIRYHKIRQVQDAGDVVISQLGTKDMAADLLTKRHGRPDHERLADMCMGHASLSLPSDLEQLLNEPATLPLSGGLPDAASRCGTCGARHERA